MAKTKFPTLGEMMYFKDPPPPPRVTRLRTICIAALSVVFLGASPNIAAQQAVLDIQASPCTMKNFPKQLADVWTNFRRDTYRSRLQFTKNLEFQTWESPGDLGFLGSYCFVVTTTRNRSVDIPYEVQITSTGGHNNKITYLPASLNPVGRTFNGRIYKGEYGSNIHAAARLSLHTSTATDIVVTASLNIDGSLSSQNIQTSGFPKTAKVTFKPHPEIDGAGIRIDGGLSLRDPANNGCDDSTPCLSINENSGKKYIFVGPNTNPVRSTVHINPSENSSAIELKCWEPNQTTGLPVRSGNGLCRLHSENGQSANKNLRGGNFYDRFFWLEVIADSNWNNKTTIPITLTPVNYLVDPQTVNVILIPTGEDVGESSEEISFSKDIPVEPDNESEQEGNPSDDGTPDDNLGSEPVDDPVDDPQVGDNNLTNPNPVNTDDGQSGTPAGSTVDEEDIDRYAAFINADQGQILRFPGSFVSQSDYDGIFRLTNRSIEPNDISVQVFDEYGRDLGAFEIALDGKEAKTIRASNLSSNYDIEASWGDLRLDINGTQALAALAYLESLDSGRLTPAHTVIDRSVHLIETELSESSEVNPEDTVKEQTIYTFNAADDSRNQSSLRLVNLGTYYESVVISGKDDTGQVSDPDNPLEMTLSPGTTTTVTALDLESAFEVTGVGRWQLTIESTPAVVIQNWMVDELGELSNLSTQAIELHEEQLTATIPLFPSSDADLGDFGVLRIFNRSVEVAEDLTIAVVDDGRTLDESLLSLSLEPGAVVELTSDDLELGNEEKGLTGSTGQGVGNWQLTITSEIEAPHVSILAYSSTVDGFLTPIHSSVQTYTEFDEELDELPTEWRYELPYFLPAISQTPSSLRFVNQQKEDMLVTIQGVDDLGVVRDDTGIAVTVPAESVKILTVQDMERGVEDGFTGNIGNGWGAWSLDIVSNAPIFIQNLVGDQINLSVQPVINYDTEEEVTE